MKVKLKAKLKQFVKNSDKDSLEDYLEKLENYLTKQNKLLKQKEVRDGKCFSGNGRG